MSQYFKKKWLVEPDERPVGWPENWEFPANAWPPGYPQHYTGTVRLSLVCPATTRIDSPVRIGCICQDSWNEPSSEWVGRFIEVDASTGGKKIRMRSSENEQWSVGGLFKIVPFQYAHFGIVKSIYFDVQDECKVDIICSLYGFDNVITAARLEMTT